MTPSTKPSTKPPLNFWQTVFAIHHRLTRRPEPTDFRQYRDTTTALHYLRKYTRLTLEEIAREIGMLPGALNQVEVKNGILQTEYCQRCKALARKYDYQQLAKWFDLAEAQNRGRRKKKPYEEPASRAYVDAGAFE